jgi:protein-S-isoprenylcysteine O-methyltransferase Ste14
MGEDGTFRMILLVGLVILVPIAAYHRVRSQLTGEKLDRSQEGLFILLTLRPLGFAMMAGLIAFIISPAAMAWSSVPLPTWMRWIGVALGVVAGVLLTWTLRTLGKNLTDTVVTKREHTLVTTGPYRWIRHPFYSSVALAVIANSLTAANWFIFISGGLVVMLLVIRSGREEENLIARFGDRYRNYMRRTGRFLPRMSSQGAAPLK